MSIKKIIPYVLHSDKNLPYNIKHGLQIDSNQILKSCKTKFTITVINFD